jgi:hypothetical protein
MLAFSTDSSAQITKTLKFCNDNTIYEENTNNSNGAGEYFFAGTTVTGNKRRGLIKFDALMEFIPPCATIQSVSLTLHMSRTISGAKNVQLRRVLEDWGESFSDAPGEEGFGTQAENGDATWRYTYYNTNSWSTAGGVFASDTSAMTSVNQIGFYTWSSAKMANDVQSWLRSPNSNNGWILIGNETETATAKRFDTHDNIDTSFVPRLTVTYINNTLPLNLGMYIEGFWDGNTMVQDTATVYLRNSTSPYAIVDSEKGIFDAFGNLTVCFDNAAAGTYYIVVKHRNSIETWSATPQVFNPFSNYYDFTSSAASAYGSNLVLKSGVYCIYSGDVNQDGTVDGTDTQLIDNDSYLFNSGYLPTDVNGDNFIDGSDASIAGNNADNFISLIRP